MVSAMMCVPMAAPAQYAPAVPPEQSAHTVLVIGDNEDGQLGISNLLSTPTFTPAPAFGSDVVAITGTDGHFSVALKADETVWACGRNTFKQIGNGGATQRVPVKIAGLSDIIAIDGGISHGLALKADGTVWSWGGANGWKLFGDSTTALVATPCLITGLTDITAIAAGICHSLALRKDGTVWIWGAWEESLPFYWDTIHQMENIPAIKMIAAGTHSMALAGDGTVWTWGHNDCGQLGDGTRKDRMPAQVPGLAGVVSIAAGYCSSFAIKNDGTVWACEGTRTTS
jgi:alpha-tubulin suppressor-like RCC1 family protein